MSMGKRGVARDPSTDRRLIKGDQPWHVFPKEPGLYVITHVPSGRKYVGCAVNLRHRIRSHIWDFKNSRHHNPFMQNLWDRDGGASFHFGLHCIHPDIATLEAAEATLIAELGTYKTDHGLNLCKEAISAIGRKWNPIQRAKMTKWTKEIIAEWVILRSQSVPVREIAKRYNASHSVVAKRTLAAGTTKRNHTVVTEDMRQQMRWMYANYAQVARIKTRFGVDKKVVFNVVADLRTPEREEISRIQRMLKVIPGKVLARATLMYVCGERIGTIAKKLNLSPVTLKKHLLQGITPSKEIVVHG